MRSAATRPGERRSRRVLWLPHAGLYRCWAWPSVSDNFARKCRWFRTAALRLSLGAERIASCPIIARRNQRS